MKLKIKFIIVACSLLSCSYGVNPATGTTRSLLMIKSETPPIADCQYATTTFDSLKADSSPIKLKVAHGCQLSDDSIITQSVAGYYFPKKFTPDHYGLSCTGVPIGDGSWVISAAHCVANDEGAGFFVDDVKQQYIMAGLANLPKEFPLNDVSKSAIRIKGIYIPKSYPGKHLDKFRDSDIALIKLDDGYKFSHPVDLIDSKLDPETKVWIAGYGMHFNNDQVLVRDGQLNYRQYYYMQDEYPLENGEIDNHRQIYALASLPEKDGKAWKLSGNGDSGGPLLWINPNNPADIKLVGTLTGPLPQYTSKTGQKVTVNEAYTEHASIYAYRNLILGIMDGSVPDTELHVMKGSARD